MNNIKKIAIIGVGFMGGSLALALREKFSNISIWGYSRSKKTYDKLKKLKILDKVTRDCRILIKDADIVVLALPIKAIIEYFKIISPFLKPGAIIFDLGSSKKEIETQAHRLLPKTANFVGCHPLCGSEKSGAEFSNKDLYKGALCLIACFSNQRAARTVRGLWRSLGSKVLFTKSDWHDKVLSCVSHLPHIISFSLTQFIPQNYLKYSSGSFKDLTRISNSPAAVWTDIFLSNKKNILKDLNKFIRTLKTYESLLKKGNKNKITGLIDKVNAKQRRII